MHLFISRREFLCHLRSLTLCFFQRSLGLIKSLLGGHCLWSYLITPCRSVQHILCRSVCSNKARANSICKAGAPQNTKSSMLLQKKQPPQYFLPLHLWEHSGVEALRMLKCLLLLAHLHKWSHKWYINAYAAFAYVDSMPRCWHLRRCFCIDSLLGATNCFLSEPSNGGGINIQKAACSYALAQTHKCKQNQCRITST